MVHTEFIVIVHTTVVHEEINNETEHTSGKKQAPRSGIMQYNEKHYDESGKHVIRRRQRGEFGCRI